MNRSVEPALRVKPQLLRVAIGLGSACALALSVGSLGGCSSTERDRYYSSRSVIIPAQMGDGSTTLAAWPYGQTSQPAATARAGSISDLTE